MESGTTVERAQAALPHGRDEVGIRDRRVRPDGEVEARVGRGARDPGPVVHETARDLWMLGLESWTPVLEEGAEVARRRPGRRNHAAIDSVGVQGPATTTPQPVRATLKGTPSACEEVGLMVNEETSLKTPGVVGEKV